MGTFSDSKIVMARRYYTCADCGGPIPRGHQYLRYLLGQRNAIQVHVSCADKKRASYNCAAMVLYAGQPSQTAGEQK